MFKTLLVDPLFNALIFLYNNVTFQDLGLAVIVLTLLIRIILYPLFYKMMRSQAAMQAIQPKVKEIQKKYKDDKAAQGEAMMALWKEHKINPLGPFLYLGIQLPILFAVYRVFMQEMNAETFQSLYSFIATPETVNAISFGLIDVTKTSMIVVVVAVVAQYIQGRLSLAVSGSAPTKQAKYMTLIGPAIALIILPRLSAALGLYWLTTSAFSIFQQRIINKQLQQEKTNVEGSK